MSSHGIEDLLFQTLDAVSRFRVSQREAIGAALEAGGLLTEAKGRLKHGEWSDWLGRVGLASRTASMWLKLAGLGLTAEDVIERGRHCPNAAGRQPQIGNGCRFGTSLSQTHPPPPPSACETRCRQVWIGRPHLACPR